jgi:hypothetical protein
MIRRRGIALLAFLLASLTVPAAATVFIGKVDTFQDGTTQGWSDGPFNPIPAVNVATGGPAGTGDRHLLLTSSGGGSAGGKLVGIAPQSWAGNYIAAGVTAIGMDVNNFGATDVSLRLLVQNSFAARAVSSVAFDLPSGSGWRHVTFSLAPAALNGLFGAVPAQLLTDVVQFRLYHATGAEFPGPDISAQLGIDNISAVPEPSTWLMLLAGLGITGFAAPRSRSA